MPPREEVLRIVRGMASDVLEGLRAASAIQHPGESGRAREGVIRGFLEQLLPDRFSIDSGFAVDADGVLSEQLDIVIYRKEYHPVFEVGGVKHYPVECIAAVIQNRASVASRASLASALGNLESVKALDRTGGGKNYVLMGGMRGHDVDPEDYNCQIWTALLTEASLARATLVEELKGWLTARPRRLWFNKYVDVGHCASFYRGPDGSATTRPLEAVALSLTKIDPSDSRLEPPLVDLASDLLNFLRVSQFIDYKPASYLPRSSASEVVFELPAPPMDASTEHADPSE